MDRLKVILLITSTCLTTTLYAKQQIVCVYDPIGKSGDAFALAKDYALEAKNWGADTGESIQITSCVAAV